MVSSELYTQLEACRYQPGMLFECWIDGVSVQVQNRGGFFIRVALPGQMGRSNEQLAPLLRLAQASLMGNAPVGLAYDRQLERACLVRWLGSQVDTSALLEAVESLVNQQAAWAQVLADQAPRTAATRPTKQAPLGLEHLQRGLMNG